MARTREPSLPLLPAANEFRERSLQIPPLNLRGQKLFPLRRSPRHRSLRRRYLTSPLQRHLWRPPAQPQELQPPLSEPQIPSGVAPEVIIRRPMLTQPPIEGIWTAERGHSILSCALTQHLPIEAGASGFFPPIA
ncbi:hypothetical protein CK203_107136 [Vitis vinifera]|uniref:Uncharacterized protein n=1 Tax=Vitis vinifera TaxID=29760 RepID=A0A438CVK3_VITVI|nr:hypothetical protein CK203_107136 [Vitis vinifera]